MGPNQDNLCGGEVDHFLKHQRRQGKAKVKPKGKFVRTASVVCSGRGGRESLKNSGTQAWLEVQSKSTVGWWEALSAWGQEGSLRIGKGLNGSSVPKDENSVESLEPPSLPL